MKVQHLGLLELCEERDRLRKVFDIRKRQAARREKKLITELELENAFKELNKALLKVKNSLAKIDKCFRMEDKFTADRSNISIESRSSLHIP